MAIITASAAGGNWNTNGAWVGGVQPTAADDVLLTATSGNITLPTATTVVARSLDCTGYTGVFTWASTTAQLNLGDASGGSAKFVAGMTVTLTGIGTLAFIATTAATTYTLTSAGKTLPNVTVAAGGTTVLQFADNLTSTGTVLLFSGTLDTNSKTVNGSVMNVTGSGGRTLTLGSSALTLSGTTPWNAPTITNLTVTANTATATFNSSTSATFSGGGKDWNGLSLIFTNTTDAVLTGTNTVKDLTRTGPAAIDGSLTLAANQTLTGNLTVNGNAAANRVWVRSSVPGTSRTLTVAGTITASRVDFEDITAAGASAPWSLAGITDGSGDMGGTSGMTLTTPATKFGVAAGNFSSTASFALTSGGSAGAPYPLPQDNVVLDASSGAGTYTMNMQRHCKDLTCTGFTGTLSMTSNVTQRYIFGSLILGSGMTFSVTGNLALVGRGSHNLDMTGKAFTAATSRMITFGRFGGTYTLLSNADFGTLVTLTTSAVTVAGGATFSANGFNVTAPVASVVLAGISMGSGTWTLTSTATATVWTVLVPTSFSAGTSTVVISGASTNVRTFAGGGQVYNDLTYTVAGSTGGLDITGANTFHDLNFSDVTNVRTLRFTAGTTTTFTGNPNIRGTAGNLMTIGSITAANHTLTKASGTVASDYLSISRSQAGGGAAWYAGSHSTDGGNNTGWIFADAPSGNFFLIF